MTRHTFLLLITLALPIAAEPPLCGTGPEAERRLAIAREQRGPSQVRALGTTLPATVRDGAFYMQNDGRITMGYRPFDLEGSLVFTPATGSTYAVQRTTSRYVEPAQAEVRNFQTFTGTDWHFVARDLAAPMSLFGRTVSRIYVSAFNGITLEPPAVQDRMVFEALDGAVHRGPVMSPLMITTRKPRQLEYPRAFIDESPGLVRVTWRSSGDAPFGYDLQAELRGDGRITYSYRRVTAMRWGTPVLSAGFDPVNTPRTLLGSVADSASDVSNEVPAAVRDMVNIELAEAWRLRDSDLYAVRIHLAAPIDRTKLAPGQTLAFQVSLGSDVAVAEVSAEPTVLPATARIEGDVVEIYGLQPKADVTTERAFRVATFYRPVSGTSDSATLEVTFAPALHTTAVDLSTVSQSAPLPLPVLEPFALGVFDPTEVWSRLQPAFALGDWEYDGVAMYQTFFTDMIFWAGAYALTGNPQVDGVGPVSPFYSTTAARRPTLIHMNQLTYNYSATEPTASKLLLHEFGHRWLYYFSLRENGLSTRSLNPVTPHPAAYVHTASAFPVYGAEEASVMGGAFFTPQGDGSWKAHAANMGYSWIDLYMMGLAAPEEVPPWFYLANTDLPKEYWPAEGAVARGDRRDVEISQVTSANGPRVPSSAASQRKFRVLFVLVTEEGKEATPAEIAKLNQWRAAMERNFALATGGRAVLSTTFVQPAKRRSARF